MLTRKTKIPSEPRPLGTLEPESNPFAVRDYWLATALVDWQSGRLPYLVKQAEMEPEAVWKASASTLQKKLGINAEQAAELSTLLKALNLDAEKLKLEELGIEYMTLVDREYPALLKEIDAPPPVLFYRGDLDALNCEYCIGVVGSRRATAYGKNIALNLGRTLGKHDIAVISGLAFGIDTEAHKGTVESGGRTVAVLGCGLDRPYPAQNKGLFNRITERGLVVSEYPPGTAPLPYHFPARNRIISGLSKLIIVVEAAERSGALITAEFALRQGREVMAVPGSIFSATSRGCHALIRDGAMPLLSPQDLLSDLGMIEQEIALPALTADEAGLLDGLSWEATSIDVIIDKSPLSPPQTSTLLTMLEFKGYVIQESGKAFMRIR